MPRTPARTARVGGVPGGRWWGLSNANSAVRRDLWEEHPFDERLPAAEDKAWAKVMLDRGYVIVHDPGAAVWHEAHGPKDAFHRNEAVQAGFRMIFPELSDAGRTQVATVVRRAGELITQRARTRDVRGFFWDVGRLPASCLRSPEA